jgi:hypothetical protein
MTEVFGMGYLNKLSEKLTMRRIREMMELFLCFGKTLFHILIR